MKQTAVEWLYQQLDEKLKEWDLIKEIIEESREMEKEHIKNAYIKGHFDSLFGMLCNSEKYYNENFKSE